MERREIETFTFQDAVNKGEDVIIVSLFPSERAIALAISSRHDGDAQVCLSPVDAERVIGILQHAVSMLET
jgi:hypothetical protein